jgi:hypothetical protein
MPAIQIYAEQIAHGIAVLATVEPPHRAGSGEIPALHAVWRNSAPAHCETRAVRFGDFDSMGGMVRLRNCADTLRHNPRSAPMSQP